ncbi:MAG: hypothetical protein IT176_11915 [Acidobacteria bacterium]|nr:hypothetical protein [Acidobacteriota bacterium]
MMNVERRFADPGLGLVDGRPFDLVVLPTAPDMSCPNTAREAFQDDPGSHGMGPIDHLHDLRKRRSAV